MNDKRYLPPRFKSWFAFYQDIKRFIRPGLDTVTWAESDIVLSEKGHLAFEEYAFSVGYIQKQTLDELIELRALETFSKPELEILAMATTQLAHYSQDKKVADVRNKVHRLLIDQLKKARG